jgi:hypothetical protein
MVVISGHDFKNITKFRFGSENDEGIKKRNRQDRSETSNEAAEVAN